MNKADTQQSSSSAPSRFNGLSAVFHTPVHSPREWSLIVLVALLFIAMPQLPKNDWDRNVADLPAALNIYHNPDYVYPPWALILFVPCYIVGAAGSRILSVLVVGCVAHRNGWNIRQFLSIVVSPLFLWTMTLSSTDVLILLVPVLLWNTSGNRWTPLVRAIAIAVLLLKPQVGLALLLPRLWEIRRDPAQIVKILSLTTLIIVPISVLGNPPLIAQWFGNISNPTFENQGLWTSNNLSMTVTLGLWPALAVISGAFIILVLQMSRLHKPWTSRHTDSAMLTASMLLSPYASNQSAVIPLAFHPAWRITALQWVGVIGAAVLNRYAQIDEWLLLGLVTLALFWSQQTNAQTQPESEALPISKRH